MSKDTLDELLGVEGKKALLGAVSDYRKGLRARRYVMFAAAFAIILYMGWIVWAGKGWLWGESLPEVYASVVKVEGMIAPNKKASAQLLNPAIKAAFEGDSKAVVLLINSPGGTPTQSYLIYDYVTKMKAKTGKPVIAVAEDMLTSGAYMVSMSADEVYAAPSTLVGSIGVRLQTIGFSGLAEKFGLERRLYTAGEDKARFDPWTPETANDAKKAAELLGELHNQFIDIVKSGRGAKLAPPAGEDSLFNGDFWVGQQAIDYGLIDGNKSLQEVLDMLGVETAVENAPRLKLDNLLRLLGF